MDFINRQSVSTREELVSAGFEGEYVEIFEKNRSEMREIEQVWLQVWPFSQHLLCDHRYPAIKVVSGVQVSATVLFAAWLFISRAATFWSSISVAQCCCETQTHDVLVELVAPLSHRFCSWALWVFVSWSSAVTQSCLCPLLPDGCIYGRDSLWPPRLQLAISSQCSASGEHALLYGVNGGTFSSLCFFNLPLLYSMLRSW